MFFIECRNKIYYIEFCKPIYIVKPLTVFIFVFGIKIDTHGKNENEIIYSNIFY
ncbi:MAG: hypothetical protein RIQ33_143 [Bacteroidota bacterium]|jgi:hypothetical protein